MVSSEDIVVCPYCGRSVPDGELRFCWICMAQICTKCARRMGTCGKCFNG